MQQGRPPRNCREAFTVEGDQVYPNRYYTPDFSMAKYLGGDLETEIRQVPILLIWTLITFYFGTVDVVCSYKVPCSLTHQ